MDFVNQYWAYIRANLEGLSASTKLLIGSLLVILLLVGFLGMLYAGKAEMQPLSGFAEGRTEQIVAKLNSAGIETKLDGGQVFVGNSDFERAIAMLAQGQLLSGDAYQAFEDMVASPWMSNAQNDSAYLKAMMKLVSGFATQIDGVKSASVILSPAQQTGFGQTHKRPSGSILATMKGGRPIPKATQIALADLVSSALAEMTPQDVTIIDGATGKSYAVPGEDDMVPTDMLELVQAIQKLHRQRIMGLLGYIQGVNVAVNVSVDPTVREQVKATTYQDSQPIKRTTESEHESRNFSDSGNAGVRPNTEMSITTGPDEVSSETETQTDTEFMPMLPSSESVKQVAGHRPERVNVTINVPRSYFVSIFKANNPDKQDPPTDTDLQTIIDDELKNITEQVQPQIATRIDGQEVPGTVVAKMVYDPAFFAGGVVQAGAAGGVVGVMGSPWIKQAGVGALALGAVALMLMLVRKATREEALPTVEELAGVPEALPTDDELIGEAQDVESTMEGLEVSDDELKSRKVAEQISDLIKSNPGEAGSLLGKWVDYDD